MGPRASWFETRFALLTTRITHASAFPRLVFARVVPIRRPSEPQRAQGKPGADRTGSLVCSEKKAYELKSLQVQPDVPAFPARWFYGFLRALPGEAAFLAP